MKHTTPSQYAKVRVIATVQDIDDGKYFIEVEYPVVGGELRRCLLPRSIMRSASKAFEKLLDLGADLPTAHGSAAMLARNVLNKVPERSYRITNRTGWHGKSFVLIDMTLGRDADTLMHRSRISSSPGDPQVKGSHKEWRSALREPCLASSYLTFGIALAFAGPLLELVGRGEGASYYLFGESSTGKTLSELVARFSQIEG